MLLYFSSWIFQEVEETDYILMGKKEHVVVFQQSILMFAEPKESNNNNLYHSNNYEAMIFSDYAGQNCRILFQSL